MTAPCFYFAYENILFDEQAKADAYTALAPVRRLVDDFADYDNLAAAAAIIIDSAHRTQLHKILRQLRERHACGSTASAVNNKH